MTWHVYMVECADGTLYTGITTDVDRRLTEHNDASLAAAYTRSRQPVRLVYRERHPSRSAAGVRECEIKRMSRADKLRLVERHAGTASR